MEKVDNLLEIEDFEMPKFSDPEVASCLLHADFAAFIPLLPTCGGAMAAV
ncbi:hypothetical protein ACP2W0_18375 [Pseudobacillus badius]|nr:hypothetical protein [Bacillus badius]UAT28954.1 hypothetical protein K7T73_09945 [Bacillus badius]GLY12939.1 hypothetical protein Bbad01_41550 [Bacillus badius]